MRKNIILGQLFGVILLTLISGFMRLNYAYADKYLYDWLYYGISGKN